MGHIASGHSEHRYEALDGLRGVSALCVMAGHFGQLLQFYWPANMFLAVDIFFMLSGFVIAHSYGHRLRRGMSGWNYMLRRAIRLYPMFLAGLLVGAVAMYLAIRNGGIGYRIEDILWGLLPNIVYLPFLSAPHFGAAVGQIFPTDPPAWSLFLEMLASGAFLLLHGRRRTVLLSITGLSFLLLLCAGVHFARADGRSGMDLNTGFSVDNVLGGLPRVAFGFTLGLLLHDLRHGGPTRRVQAALARTPYPSFVLYVFLFAVLLCQKSIRGAYPLAVLLALAPAIICIGASIRTRHGIETQVARFLGWISYPIYCLHLPIMRFVVFDGIDGEGVAIKLTVGVVATLLATVVLAKWYEEPVRAALSRRFVAPWPTLPAGSPPLPLSPERQAPTA